MKPMIADLFFDTKRYPFDETSAAPFREHYQRHDYVKFPGLLKGPGFALLQAEVARLRDFAFRRDFQMECMGNSPRQMSTLGGDGVTELSTIVPLLYAHPPLLDFLTFICGSRVLTLEDIDRYVVNDLHTPGDTFGAHFDDYPISLVFMVDGPPESSGGVPELVPHGALSDLGGPKTVRVPLEPGDAYMLKSDTTAHRVAPLKVPSRRTALNLAYTTEGFVIASPTDSASLLYKKGYKRRGESES